VGGASLRDSPRVFESRFLKKERKMLVGGNGSRRPRMLLVALSLSRGFERVVWRRASADDFWQNQYHKINYPRSSGVSMC